MPVAAVAASSEPKLDTH